MNEDFYLCPQCGNDVKVGAKYCPTCGPAKPQPRRKTQKRKSWEQDETSDGLDLPDDDFDYEDFVANEFGKGPAHKQLGLAWYWWATAVLLLVTFFAFYFGS